MHSVYVNCFYQFYQYIRTNMQQCKIFDPFMLTHAFEKEVGV